MKTGIAKVIIEDLVFQNLFRLVLQKIVSYFYYIVIVIDMPTKGI